MQLRQLAATFEAFSDPTRLRILNLLGAHPGVNVSALTEALELPQSTISRALGLLRAGGFVSDERSGRFVYYELVEGPLMGPDELPGLLRKMALRSPELKHDLRRLNAILRGL